jgi:hypothetical protein
MGQFQAGSTMVAPSILMAIGLIRMLMPRIIKPILLGLLIGTALMIATYGSAAMGSASAINLLMKMTLPSFNVAVILAQPVAPDDLERGAQQLDFLLMVAWLQISLISAAIVAAARAVLARPKYPPHSCTPAEDQGSFHMSAQSQRAIR